MTVPVPEAEAIMGTSKSQSPLSTILDACGESSQSLTTALDMLEKKLGPVMHEAPQREQPDCAEDPQSSGSVVAELTRQNIRLIVLKDQVLSLLERLDV